MKTITQHLGELPEPYRSQALKNLDYEKRNETAPTLRAALARAFLFYRAPEKYKYWNDYFDSLPLEL